MFKGIYTRRPQCVHDGSWITERGNGMNGNALTGRRPAGAIAMVVGIAFAFTALAAPRARAADAYSCDRECLRGMVTSVLHAFAKHDTSRLPLAATLRVTEDSAEKPLDKVGLLKSVTKLRGYRQDFIDERTGIVGAHVVVEESGAPVLLVVRLKVENGRISELETVATRSKADGSLFNIDGLGHPSEEMAKVPRPDQLPSREEAIRIALLYPAGLEAGSFVKTDTPFTPEAFRLETAI